MPVSGDVSYYQVFEAHTQNVSLPSDSSYQLVYSGSSTVARRTIYTTRYRWYRYKACNSAGCSGLSPYRRVYVYDSAGVPNNFAVSLSPAAVNTNYTLSWTPANGGIDGTVYRLYEINGQTESLVYSVTRNHWSERFYDYDTSKSTGGDYQYRVEACSPSVACGYSATLSQTILAPNAAPVVSPSTPTHNSVYTAVTPVVASAQAADNDGSVSAVEFQLDGGSWFADTSAPYFLSFGILTPGSHTMGFRARDNHETFW